MRAAGCRRKEEGNCGTTLSESKRIVPLSSSLLQKMMEVGLMVFVWVLSRSRVIWAPAVLCYTQSV